MKTLICISLLIGSSCFAQQATNLPKPDLSRLAEDFRRLKREPPKLDAEALQRIETLRLRVVTLQADRTRKAQEEPQKKMDKPGDYWSPGELDRLRKRPTAEPKG